MTDHNRWDEDRYDDRSRLQDYRAGELYGQGPGQGRYPRQSQGGRSYESQGDYRGERYDQSYAGVGRFGENRYGGEGRAFGSGADPYAATGYPGYGEPGYRASHYGDDNRNEHYGNRQAAGAMMHQGYRAPLGGTDYDRNFYSGGQSPTRYQSSDYNRPDYAAYGSRGSQGHDRGFWDQTRDEVSSWFGDKDAERRRQMDGANADHHRGKGPKSYTRSDSRIQEDVNDRLTDDYLLDASDIETKVSDAEVTLTGTVLNRRDKRRAEDIAEDVTGVKHVPNHLRVKDAAASTSTATSTAGADTSLGSLGGSTTRSN